MYQSFLEVLSLHQYDFFLCRKSWGQLCSTKYVACHSGLKLFYSLFFVVREKIVGAI